MENFQDFRPGRAREIAEADVMNPGQVGLINCRMQDALSICRLTELRQTCSRWTADRIAGPRPNRARFSFKPGVGSGVQPAAQL